MPATENISSFLAMDIMRLANQRDQLMGDVCHLEVGQPSTPVPPSVQKVVIDALQNQVIGYTDALGQISLRERIAKYYQEMHGLSVDPGRIAVTTGSSAAFTLSFLSCFEKDARIAMPSPCYPAYRNILKANQMECVEIQVSEETNWALTPEMLRCEHKKQSLDGLLLASPNNPTGTMLSPQALKSLIEAAEDLDIQFISDEIYHRLCYAQDFETALKFSDKAIIINSFSKYYCMTGWRIGWMVVPNTQAALIERLAQNLYISPPALSQYAAQKALDETSYYDAVKNSYATNRKILIEACQSLGFDKILPADGAFYLYVSVKSLTNNSLDFAKTMLNEIGVASASGLDFDLEHGHEYLRFSYAGSQETIEEAAARLKTWLG